MIRILSAEAPTVVVTREGWLRGVEKWSALIGEHLSASTTPEEP